MDWHSLFPTERQPTYEDIENYIGGAAKDLWVSLFDFMDKTYNAKPKMTYSGCSGKPGWNVKFQKSGQSFGTLYPEKNGFSVFMVISYKLEPAADLCLPMLSPKVREAYQSAGDYMKMGKWMMFRIEDKTDLDDYKLLCSVKLKPKTSKEIM
ncbi:MAG: DUF3788 domain-containing protein [Oscillospiraceae bacterium]|jgi:AraC family transcriptional regulator|nr:DUF3788 domain-containing protein [Oscillospiraceae bacterium]